MMAGRLDSGGVFATDAASASGVRPVCGAPFGPSASDASAVPTGLIIFINASISNPPPSNSPIVALP